MRYRPRDQWRDLVVHLLARLSLVVVLAVMGALFVGSAATTQAASDRAPEPSVSTDDDRLRPAGILIGATVIGGGLVVLLIGAFRPPTSRERRDLTDLLNE